MIFLIFGVINLIAAIVMAIFAFMSPNPASFVSLITAILNCILFFGLYGMRKDVDANKESISSLQKSLNECRKKLGLSSKKQCPNCSNFVVEEGTNECPHCGHELK
ncbi:MAG: hypothetical protein IJX09_03570 [Clostridia bacterium]|nr:hypothetical protein [Clostridia bacterium]